jgi:hypothetical protein
MKPNLVLFGMFLITSCSQENNPPSNGQSNTFSNQMFPNSVGNEWVYQYNDGLDSNQYIYVDIVGTTTLPGGQNATVWTSTLKYGTNQEFLLDSSYVVVDDQKAVFYAPPCLTCIPSVIEEKERYVFPLQVNKRWFTDKVYGDTTKVLEEGSITVPAGTFDNTFKLSRTIGYVNNSFTKDTTWLTPNVGMIKYYQDHYSLGPIPGNGVWELASCHLK